MKYKKPLFTLITLEGSLLKIVRGKNIFQDILYNTVMLNNDPTKIYRFDYHPEFFVLSKVNIRIKEEFSIQISYEVIAKLPNL